MHPEYPFLQIYVLIETAVDVKTVFKLIKDKKIRCYSLSCHFLVRFVNGCPESKILSLKYPHSQLLIQISKFYIGICHKLLKSKHLFF